MSISLWIKIKMKKIRIKIKMKIRKGTKSIISLISPSFSGTGLAKFMLIMKIFLDLLHFRKPLSL